MTTKEKFNNLISSLKQMDKVIIAYSGGVDSTFLLKAASLSGLGDILAVTALSESLPEEEAAFAGEMASSLQINQRTIVTEELRDENYANNPPNRCYYCKKELFTKLKRIADKEGFRYILDGTNADDAGDRRPGRKAAKETGVRSPLLESGFSKDEIRELSRDLGLQSWDKPATPCLSSRFPYGQVITAESLDKVHRAENFLKKFGFKELRVRHHAEVARVEVPADEFSILMDDRVRKEVITFLKSLGYKFVTLDLQGFRSGSSNEMLESRE